MQDHSARIAKAKAMAQAFGLPEQDVIKLALEQVDPNPLVRSRAAQALAALHGREQGLHTLGDAVNASSVTTGPRNIQHHAINFQASGVEEAPQPFSGEVQVPPPPPMDPRTIKTQRKPDPREPITSPVVSPLDWLKGFVR